MTSFNGLGLPGILSAAASGRRAILEVDSGALAFRKNGEWSCAIEGTLGGSLLVTVLSGTWTLSDDSLSLVWTGSSENGLSDYETLVEAGAVLVLKDWGEGDLAFMYSRGEAQPWLTFQFRKD